MKRKIYLSERIKYAVFSLWAAAGALTVFCVILAKENEALRWLAAAAAVFLTAWTCLVWRMITWPYLKLQKLYRLYADGYYLEKMTGYEVQIDRDVERAQEQMTARFDRGRLLSLSKRQAEYLALQNQINPHFLYNTLEGIRSEAILAGMDSVAEMTEALGTFFRYTISRMDHLVTLEDELANIENYYFIQQYRFGDRLSLSIEYEDEDIEAFACMIPKLTLQPIVENAVYHGLEEKVGKGQLTIRIAMTERYLSITVSDNGVGMDAEKLRELNRKLSMGPLEEEQAAAERREGIAVVNVNNRIRLLFGEEYGLYFYSTPDVGTDVEIILPIRKGRDAKPGALPQAGGRRDGHERRNSGYGSCDDG